MEQRPVLSDKIQEREPIVLENLFERKRSHLPGLLIVCLLLGGVIALGYLWAHSGGDGGAGDSPPHSWGSLSEETNPSESEESERATLPTESESTGDTESSVEELLPSPVGRTAIVSLDLSLSERGSTFLINESIHLPLLSDVMERSVSSRIGEEPLVLILHTHTGEGYLRERRDFIDGALGDETYTEDPSRSVIATGRALSEALRAQGIGTIHCTTVHDKDGMRGAYTAAAESIHFFLTLYPSIRYVVDLQRDAILNENGEYVRAENEDGIAQVLPVVGSDGSGSANGNWEDNLALALGLRERLNADGARVCRPVTLRNSSYNQELAPYSLLLEIGTGATAVSDAVRAAEAVGKALGELIRGS